MNFWILSGTLKSLRTRSLNSVCEKLGACSSALLFAIDMFRIGHVPLLFLLPRERMGPGAIVQGSATERSPAAFRDCSIRRTCKRRFKNPTTNPFWTAASCSPAHTASRSTSNPASGSPRRRATGTYPDIRSSHPVEQPSLDGSGTRPGDAGTFAEFADL